MLHFKFADVAEGLESGKVIEVFVKEGDTVEEGDDLFSVETEKVSTEITTPVEGTIAKILIKPDEEIKVGQVVMHIDDSDDEQDSADEPEKPASVVGAITISDDIIPTRGTPVRPTPVAVATEQFVNTDIKSTPLVRKMAANLKVDLKFIKGTGVDGKIMKKDVENYMNQKQTTHVVPPTPQPMQPMPAPITPQIVPQQPQVRPAPINLPPLMAGNFTGNDEIELQAISNIRRAIAKAMTTSKSNIPEITLMREVNVDKLWTLRSKLKNDAMARGVKLTFMGFFIKALALALTQFPNLNAVLDEKNNQLKIKKFYNIGMAVDAPVGLMVPVIKNADQKSVFVIAKEVVDLAGKIRTNTATGQDLSDGTFSITNYGSVGIEFATPIIKYPEAGIMGVGAIKRKPVVDDDGTIKAAYILPVSLVVDHRIVDGADAGRFLNAFIYLLENPMSLLI